MKYLLRKCEIFAYANVGKFYFIFCRKTKYFTIFIENYFTLRSNISSKIRACSSVGRAFGSQPKGRGFDSLQVHHIRTKVIIPLVLQLSFFLSKQALFLTISKNNSILFMMSFSHRRLRSVSSGERGARHCAELWCGTATVDIVPP